MQSLGQVAAGCAVLVSVVAYPACALSQPASTYEDIVMDDLVVCSELEGITKSTMLDFYTATTRQSILWQFAAPKPVPSLPPVLRTFVATDGRLGDDVLDCLSSEGAGQLDLVAMTQDSIASLEQHLPDGVFPDWMKLGPQIVAWETNCTGDDCIITYVRWNYDPSDAQAVLDDFFGLPD